MSLHQATISKILTFSCVDGPGNRLVLFFQGCNFNCPTCHNPHTIGICNDCGDCIPACHVDALSLVEGKILFDPTNCDQCDVCTDICPINANPMVQQYSVEEILQLAHDNLSCLTGVTVSGGEATLHLKFVVELFTAIKADPELSRLTCFIDTNGHLGEAAWQKLLPVTDGVMLDIKAFDPEIHQRLTGKDNRKSLHSIEILQNTGKLYELRFLVVPQQNDTEDEYRQLEKLALELGPDVRIKLNAFQHHGVKGAARDWPKMTETKIDRIAEKLLAAGAQYIHTPSIYF